MAYSLRSYAIFLHFSPCYSSVLLRYYSSVVLRVGTSTAEIPRAMLSHWVAEQDSKLKQLNRAVFGGFMGLFFGCLFLLELAFGLAHSAN
jgi:Na+/melibiose symporter-like transporter